MSEEIKDQAVEETKDELTKQDEKRIEGEIDAEANFQEHMGGLGLGLGRVNKPEEGTKTEDKKVEDKVEDTKTKDEDKTKEKVDDKDKVEDKKEDKKSLTQEEIIAGLRKIAGGDNEIDLSKLEIEPAKKPEDKKPDEKVIETPKPPELKEELKEEDKKEDEKPAEMTDEDFSAMMENKDKFKTFTDNMTSDIVNKVSETVLKSLGDVITNSVGAQMQLMNIAKDFLDNNKDLIPFQKRLAQVSDAIASQHPDLPADKAFEFAGKYVRDELNMTKQVEKKEELKQEDKSPKENKGGFANSTSGNNGNNPDADLNTNENFETTRKLMKMSQVSKPK